MVNRGILQHNCVGDTIVYHTDSKIKFIIPVLKFKTTCLKRPHVQWSFIQSHCQGIPWVTYHRSHEFHEQPNKIKYRRLGSTLQKLLSAGRADSRFVPSQWETLLKSNTVSHWLGTNLESALAGLSYLSMPPLVEYICRCSGGWSCIVGNSWNDWGKPSPEFEPNSAARHHRSPSGCSSHPPTSLKKKGVV